MPSVMKQTQTLIHRVELLLSDIDMAILSCPSGEARNALCEANLSILLTKEILTEESKKMFRSKTTNGVLVDVCWHNKRAAENWIFDHKDQINNIIETNNLEVLQHLINWKRVLLEANQSLIECGELK